MSFDNTELEAQHRAAELGQDEFHRADYLTLPVHRFDTEPLACVDCAHVTGCDARDPSTCDGYEAKAKSTEQLTFMQKANRALDDLKNNE